MRQKSSLSPRPPSERLLSGLSRPAAAPHAQSSGKKKGRTLAVCLLTFLLAGCAPADAGQDARASSPSASTLPPLTATFFDCGKADSTLVQAGGYTLLIDTATHKDGKDVAQKLRQLGVEAIDALLITHPHKDHVGGADIILESFSVSQVLEGPLQVDSKQVDQYRQALGDAALTPRVLRAGDSFVLGEMRVDVLGPIREAYADENDLSLVFRLTYGETVFLFTGDAEKDALSDLLASGAPLKADVLKVPHHGKGEDNSTLFFSAVAPSIAVVPCARGTEDQLPEETRVVEPLQSLGAQVFVTDDGDVRVTSDGKNLSAAQ